MKRYVAVGTHTGYRHTYTNYTIATLHTYDIPDVGQLVDGPIV